MQARHLLPMALALCLGLAIGLRRGLPAAYEAPVRCPRPVGVLDRQAERRPVIAVCLAGERAPLSDVLRRAGSRCRGAGETVASGTLLRILAGCGVERGRLPGATRLALGLTVDINRASVEDLRALPRVGPVLAGRIVALRRRRGPFPSVDRITDVRGIGPATFERLRHHISAGISRLQPANARVTSGEARTR